MAGFNNHNRPRLGWTPTATKKNDSYQLSVNVPKDVLERIVERSYVEERTVQDIVRRILSEAFPPETVMIPRKAAPPKTKGYDHAAPQQMRWSRPQAEAD